MAMIFSGRNRVSNPYSYNAIFNTGHGGVDVIGDDDKSIHSTASGKVTTVYRWNGKVTKGDTNSYGNFVVVTASTGERHFYAHMQSISVALGQSVNVGDVLGIMGSTGNSSGPHCHYEVRKGTKKSTRVNPASYCDVQNKRGTYTQCEVPNVFYKVYANKWLPEVENCNDYAGNENIAVSGISARLSRGSIKYRVHQIGKGWLPWVTDMNGYAGNLGKSVDKLQMTLVGLDGYNVQYRTSAIGNDNFYSWVTDFNNVLSSGYAGSTGKQIDKLQIRIVKA